jgi:ankyrin repeat protein
MNRICIAALMTVMICASGCGPEAKKPTPREAFEATQELHSLGYGNKGYRADFILVLISEGADVNAKDDRGKTPLFKAIDVVSLEIVTLLIEAGADVKAKNDYDWTPLMSAASKSEYPEMVRVLIEAGADVLAKTHGGETPLWWAKTPEIVTLLIEAGADVNAKDDKGRTPLSLAKNPEIVKLLKAAGARE